MTGLLIPWWTKYLALAAVALSLWAHGYMTGSDRAERRYDALGASEAAAAQAEIARLSALKEKVTTVYMDRVRVIEGQARTITREVPHYVTAKSDAACPVPVGLVRLWDDAAGVQAALYQPAAGVDDAAPDLALSDVGRGIVEARRRFEVNSAQCTALQAWARGLGGAR